MCHNMCKIKSILNPFMRLHNWWLSFAETHPKWKLVIQLFFGALLSFAGAVLLSKVQHFINLEGWQNFYSYWLVESMPGLVYLAFAIFVGLYVIISILGKDSQSEKADRREIVRLLRHIAGEDENNGNETKKH